MKLFGKVGVWDLYNLGWDGYCVVISFLFEVVWFILGVVDDKM